MQNELWKQLCIQNNVAGLAGCLYEGGTAHGFYFGRTQKGEPMTARTAFKAGVLGRWVKALAATRCCFLTGVDLTEPDLDTDETLLSLMRTNETVFDHAMTQISGMDTGTMIQTFLTRPLYLSYTHLDGNDFVTTPTSYTDIIRTVTAGILGRSRILTPAMIAALFAPTPLPGFECDDFGCFGLTDSGTDFAAGFAMDIERRRALVLMSDDPTAASMIQSVLTPQ